MFVQAITVQLSVDLYIVCKLKHWSYAKGVNTKTYCDYRSKSATSLLFIRTNPRIIKLVFFGLLWGVGVA